MADVFTVEMGEEEYSLVAPDGRAGAPVPYEEGTASVMWNGVLYYAHVDDPDEFPEQGPAPTVFRVDSTTVMESEMVEVEDDDDDEDGEGEDEEEDLDSDSESREPVQGDVIEFPQSEEDDDENLPPADQQ